ncbi:MAG: hypothetical protein AB7I27_14195 [Bacteriovoracaceae bacterium]
MFSKKIFVLLTIFFSFHTHSQSITIERLEGMPIEEWPKEEVFLFESGKFQVFMENDSSKFSEVCRKPLRSKEHYLDFLKYLRAIAFPRLHNSLIQLTRLHPHYADVWDSKIDLLKIRLELQVDISCSGNGSENEESGPNQPTLSNRFVSLGLASDLSDKDAIEEVLAHESGHFISAFFIPKHAAGTIPLEETIADVFALWSKSSGPTPYILSGKIWEETWYDILEMFEQAGSSTINWMGLKHAIDSGSITHLRDFRKDFTFDRIFLWNEPHFVSSVFLNALYRVTWPSYFYQALEQFLIQFARRPELFLSHRIDLVMDKIVSPEAKIKLMESGWFRPYQQVDLDLKINAFHEGETINIVFNPENLSVDANNLFDPYKFIIHPFELLINDTIVSSFTSIRSNQNEQLSLRFVLSCDSRYGAHPCFCANTDDLLTFRFYFLSSGKEYLESTLIRVPVDLDGCYEIEQVFN